MSEIDEIEEQRRLTEEEVIEDVREMMLSAVFDIDNRIMRSQFIANLSGSAKVYLDSGSIRQFVQQKM